MSHKHFFHMSQMRWLVAPLLCLAAAPAAHAEDSSLKLTVSEGRLVMLPGPASTVFIADPSIADVQVPLPNRVFVIGRKPGHTTLYALRQDGVRVVGIDLEVSGPVDTATQVLDNQAGTTSVSVQTTGSDINMKGSAADPASAAVAADEVKAISADTKVDDHSSVRGSAQVNLRVRIAEVSRTVTKDLGVNWQSVINSGHFTFALATAAGPTGTGLLQTIFHTNNFNIDNVIDALAQEGLLSILAEPNLTAMSGESADFLAGGEFPLPIAQNSGTGGPTITVAYKEYGVSLDFVPTVLSPNHISMRVRPEVSELAQAGSVTVNGLTLPALTVRRADTTIELGSGQSFVIGGLLENRLNTNNQNFPGLSDLPVLGPLFRSVQFERDETELLIIVTPTIVQPIDQVDAVRMPMDGMRAPNDFEQLLLDHVAERSTPHAPGTPRPPLDPTLPRLAGDAGFDLN
jgi:pilus assembly protein CpaC